MFFQKEKSQPLIIYRKIALSFVVLTALLLMIVLYLSLSKAQILITSLKERISSDLILDLEKNPTSSDILKGEVWETTTQGSKNFKISGGRTVDARAEGKVILKNKSNIAQPLVAATRLLSSEGILFRLKENILVPANGETEVNIYADQIGKKGEIKPSRFILPGLFGQRQEEVYGVSYAPMQGGSKEIKFITQEDINQALDELKGDLYKKALNDFQNKAGKGDKVLAQADKVIENTVSAKAGEEKDGFTASMKLKVGGVGFSEQKLFSLARKKLESILPSDKELITPTSKNLSYSLAKYDFQGGRANIKVNITGDMVIKVNSSFLDKDKIAGMEEKTASAYLLKLPSVEKVKIILTPFWTRSIPRLKDHIEIIIIK